MLRKFRLSSFNMNCPLFGEQRKHLSILPRNWNNFSLVFLKMDPSQHLPKVVPTDLLQCLGPLDQLMWKMAPFRDPFLASWGHHIPRGLRCRPVNFLTSCEKKHLGFCRQTVKAAKCLKLLRFKETPWDW